MTLPTISIIIPVYNEERRCAASLRKLAGFAQESGYISEIIFVDDGSVDRTAVLIEDFQKQCGKMRLIRHDGNKGKGAAVRTGMRDALITGTADFLLFTDIDLSTPLEETIRLTLIAKEKKAGLIIGSRSMPESVVTTLPPLNRRIISKIFNTARRCIILPDIHDSQCGFKLFSRSAAEIIFLRQKIDGFAFDVEIITIAQIHNIIVKEVGVIWNYEVGGNLKIIPTSLRMIRDIISVRMNVFFGKYK